jgi:hypothetical protein
VLLVLFTLPESAARMAQLAQEHARLREAGAQIVAVPLAGEALEAPDTPFPVIADGAAETARTYALLRRTLANLDARDAAPMPVHMEMLVDRFGYIRARWVMGDGEVAAPGAAADPACSARPRAAGAAAAGRARALTRTPNGRRVRIQEGNR